ncbi:MAG: AAA family ATPase [Pyrinomonadaceae bacterium]|nr:AAA family ATPase [Pyrinomonadaceae bacterium]
MEKLNPPKRLSWAEMLDVLTESDRKRQTVIERATETERMVLFLLRREGWSAQVSPNDVKDYDVLAQNQFEKVAVQVRNHRAKVHLGQIEKFLKFLNQPNSLRLNQGIYISSSGFTSSVYSHLREEKITNLKLAILKDNRLIWDCEKFDLPIERDKKTYIGVFTCKGGVGKTTIAAHLAGAFALNGYDVGLIDLDHQKNLKKILGESVFIPQTQSKISVFNPENWNERNHKDKKIIICDCNPEFEANPKEFIQKFDYCLIPTTLNPLGINKNADVIKRTFDAIRGENPKAELFVLINNLMSDEEGRNSFLNQILKSQFKQMTENDNKTHYIDPFDVAIRFSKQLLYWGFHIFENEKPQLAFRSKGGYSYPRMDFLKLVDYLEMQTEILKIKTPKFLV